MIHVVTSAFRKEANDNTLQPPAHIHDSSTIKPYAS
jgi:hypothetical protein